MPIVKDLPLVPAERALKVIGGRWKVFILYYLFTGPKRLSEYEVGAAFRGLFTMTRIRPARFETLRPEGDAKAWLATLVRI